MSSPESEKSGLISALPRGVPDAVTHHFRVSRLSRNTCDWSPYAETVFRAVTSISIFMRGSDRPAEIMVAAGRIRSKYFLNIGQHGSKSSALGKM